MRFESVFACARLMRSVQFCAGKMQPVLFSSASGTHWNCKH
ncbi:unnamed protein product [Staurois parvus]|uniref:Uncharacterized protein n=1 Tax=Staurois parvus TaxID=386267 RepID=A0ABN9AGZ9_9NEOB|nr:unnamed protein product [Staurois parvus]